MKELKELRALTEEINRKNIKLTDGELINLLLATIEINSAPGQNKTAVREGEPKTAVGKGAMT